MAEVVTIILAGGRGSRLYPLTKRRSKPAVPIAGKFRLIDISISNCIHSGLRKIFILTQFSMQIASKFFTFHFLLLTCALALCLFGEFYNKPINLVPTKV